MLRVKSKKPGRNVFKTGDEKRRFSSRCWRGGGDNQTNAKTTRGGEPISRITRNLQQITWGERDATGGRDPSVVTGQPKGS